MSLWSSALSVDELDDRPWISMMPWLDRYGSARTAALAALVPTARWWEVRSPAETAADVDIAEVCSELARIYVTDHPELRFADGLIREVEVPVAALDLGAAAASVVARLPHAPTTAELFSRSPADLFSVRGSDREAVLEIVCAALLVTVLRDPSALRPDPAAPSVPALTVLVDDLAALARWRMLHGETERPLLRVDLEVGAPEEIQEVAARIEALAAKDLPVSVPTDPVAELADFVAALPEPDREVLRRRVHAEGEPDPDAPSTFPFGTAVGDLLAALRVEVRPVAAFDRIVRAHPVLTRPVPGLDAPLWQVLDRLDDRFAVADGWIAVPDLSDAEKQTRALLSEFESVHGVVEPAAVAATWQLPAAELESWLTYCGTTMFEGRILARQDDLACRAAQILEVVGDPLSAPDLAARTGTTGTDALVEQLSQDERFTTADDLWALAEWDSDPVAAIATRLGRLVDDAGGSVGLDDVAAALVERFSISDASARIFAASGDFEIVDGRVRRRPRAHVPLTPPYRTRHLYDVGDEWRLRIPVTRDHVRGAESTVPSAVAGIVGCAPGGHLVLSSRLGGQMLRWSGAVPQLGSVRRFLDDLGVGEGGEVLLEFRPDGRFDVLPLRTVADNADPLRRALALVGYTTPEVVPEDRLTAALATAIGLDAGTRPRRILSAYRARRETDVVAVLEAAWVRVPG